MAWTYMIRSESSRAIWLLRFFGLSSTSTLRVGVAKDAKLYLEDFSSVDPKMLCSVFSARQNSIRSRSHPLHQQEDNEGIGPLTVQIIEIIVVLVLVVAELFINGAPANIAYDAARPSRLAGLML